MAKITEEQYFGLADKIYRNQSLRINPIRPLSEFKESDLLPLTLDDKSKWITIGSIDKKSGIQAAAVVPYKEYIDVCSGKTKEFTNIVFTSRGSEDKADWSTNLTDLPKHKLPKQDSQFKEYDNFVKNTLSSHTTKDYSFTGHSLGGALAQYEAVKHTKPAITFAAARSFNKLTPEEQAKAKNGDYFQLIKDFRHTGDAVGLLPPNAFVFYQQYYSANGAASDPINAHLTEGFRKQFSSNGTTKLAISPDEIKAQADIIKSVATDIDRMIRLLEDFRRYESDAVKKMISKANNQTYGGEYDLLNENDVDNIVHDLAVSRTEGVYRFHDEEILHDLFNKLLERQYHLQQFAHEIGTAGQHMLQTDINLGHDLENTVGSLLGIAAGNAASYFSK
ncbi:hypothetical protein BMT55_01965 [Listeria newyorkensis]|uniref:Lipase (Class 3) n=1 Tax=Listeria newyorkensis TaxID=1497681 RepID=A0ABX4XQY8_9LIST|nr:MULTISPECIES: DUF6792 domain-containing protein [Listeria]KGL46386.1 hypothetical protein EP56_01995 [Listeriaceae bacterium FSL A5-0209]KGL41814.1 hypothetical protein EP58_09715 [Listeria newyorkensis]KMT58300.1 hypothetical protein X559_3057 [Listeria newyorkensis]PNP94277.1 hypothetical protein BMT55_01965 [Listeria newyorkensis]WAO22690.1 lipase [Listeria newyorkensis]